MVPCFDAWLEAEMRMRKCVNFTHFCFAEMRKCSKQKCISRSRNAAVTELAACRLCSNRANFYIPALLFADDGLQMENSLKQAEQLLDVMRDAARRCGLEMNAMESKCMIFNYRGAPIELLKGMEVVEHAS